MNKKTVVLGLLFLVLVGMLLFSLYPSEGGVIVQAAKNKIVGIFPTPTVMPTPIPTVVMPTATATPYVVFEEVMPDDDGKEVLLQQLSDGKVAYKPVPPTATPEFCSDYTTSPPFIPVAGREVNESAPINQMQLTYLSQDIQDHYVDLTFQVFGATPEDWQQLTQPLTYDWGLSINGELHSRNFGCVGNEELVAEADTSAGILYIRIHSNVNTRPIDPQPIEVKKQYGEMFGQPILEYPIFLTPEPKQPTFGWLQIQDQVFWFRLPE